jgi:uncharacterized membrane protein
MGGPLDRPLTFRKKWRFSIEFRISYSRRALKPVAQDLISIYASTNNGDRGSWHLRLGEIKTMTVSWLIAALIFFLFAVIFWSFGNDPIRSFAIRQRIEDENPEAGESKSDKVIAAFLRDFEGYLKSINARNKFRYRIATGGFVMAGLTCVLLTFALK